MSQFGGMNNSGSFLDSLRNLSAPQSRYLGIGMNLAKSLPQGEQQGAILRQLMGLGSNLQGYSGGAPNAQFGGLGGILQFLGGM